MKHLVLIFFKKCSILLTNQWFYFMYIFQGNGIFQYLFQKF